MKYIKAYTWLVDRFLINKYNDRKLRVNLILFQIFFFHNYKKYQEKLSRTKYEVYQDHNLSVPINLQ